MGREYHPPFFSLFRISALNCHQPLDLIGQGLKFGKNQVDQNLILKFLIAAEVTWNHRNKLIHGKIDKTDVTYLARLCFILMKSYAKLLTSGQLFPVANDS